MNGIEEAARSGYKAVVYGILGNRIDDNYEELVQNMLKIYKALGVNLIIKVHYFHSQLDKFPDNLGAYSDEQGERFHEDMKVMKESVECEDVEGQINYPTEFINSLTLRVMPPHRLNSRDEELMPEEKEQSYVVYSKQAAVSRGRTAAYRRRRCTSWETLEGSAKFCRLFRFYFP
ncbi:POLD1 [Cordylochernes scorpioides]|uniref:POLD1 n=1 Tax=Cordylochernes scorpioides TaxID=51811 RepID=A0ABY6LT43_9ARAC|nr:POLD1 [Cordylochernes scorpioides]